MSMVIEGWLDAAEAAKRLHTSVRTVTRWAQNGKLEHRRWGDPKPDGSYPSNAPYMFQQDVVDAFKASQDQEQSEDGAQPA